MTLPDIRDAAEKLAVTARNSEVQELAGLVRALAAESHELIEFLADTKTEKQVPHPELPLQ